MSLEAKIEERLGEGVRVTRTTVRKNNGVEMSGCSICKDGSNICPVIYYNPEWNGDRIVDYVIAGYNRSIQDDLDFKNNIQRVLHSKDEVLKRVVPVLVNTSKNDLQDVVNIPYHDLSIIFRVQVQEGASFKITSQLMAHYNLSAEELFRAALANLEKSWKILSFEDIAKKLPGIPGLSDDDFDAFPMLILSNNDSFYGASSMLSQAALMKMAERLGNGYFILPSSIHEVICIPNIGGDTEMLFEMVRSINRSVLDSVDVLSDSVYRFVDGRIEDVAV